MLTEAATGRRMVGRVWRVAVAMVAVSLVAGCASLASERSPSAADGIEAVVGEHPDVPVAVPTELPDGYAFAGGAGVFETEGEPVASQWLYAPSGRSSDPPVHVCVVARGGDEFACSLPGRGERLERLTARYRVIVESADADDPDVGAWADTDFTGDWRVPDWTDEPGT